MEIRKSILCHFSTSNTKNEHYYLFCGRLHNL